MNQTSFTCLPHWVSAAGVSRRRLATHETRGDGNSREEGTRQIGWHRERENRALPTVRPQQSVDSKGQWNAGSSVDRIDEFFGPRALRPGEQCFGLRRRPDTAAHYEAAFEQTWGDMHHFSSSEIAEGWIEMPERPGPPPFALAFSPHKSADVSLDRVAEAIKNAKSSIFFAIMGLGGGGTVLSQIKQLIADRKDIFSYGVTQSLSGASVYKPGSSNGVLTPFAFLQKHVPPPFDAEISGGVGQVIHDKFVVIDFNTASPIVFTGSSNLAAGGEQDNGDNLIELNDKDVASIFGVQAVGLVDRFHFRGYEVGNRREATYVKQRKLVVFLLRFEDTPIPRSDAVLPANIGLILYPPSQSGATLAGGAGKLPVRIRARLTREKGRSAGNLAAATQSEGQGNEHAGESRSSDRRWVAVGGDRRRADRLFTEGRSRWPARLRPCRNRNRGKQGLRTNHRQQGRAPYINGVLQAEGADLTQMFGEEHHSEGNYFWLLSGSNQRVGFEDAIPAKPISASNLGQCLIAAGRSFKGYSVDLPAIGSTVKSAGLYARKHVPWISFSNIPNGKTVQDSSNLRFADFPSDYTKLPTVAFVIPNLVNDMHNGMPPFSVKAGDTWLKEHLDGYYQWAKLHNSLLIITFDEDSHGPAGPTNPGSSAPASRNRIPTIIAGVTSNMASTPKAKASRT